MPDDTIASRGPPLPASTRYQNELINAAAERSPLAGVRRLIEAVECNREADRVEARVVSRDTEFKIGTRTVRASFPAEWSVRKVLKWLEAECAAGKIDLVIAVDPAAQTFGYYWNPNEDYLRREIEKGRRAKHAARDEVDAHELLRRMFGGLLTPSSEDD